MGLGRVEGRGCYWQADLSRIAPPLSLLPSMSFSLTISPTMPLSQSPSENLTSRRHLHLLLYICNQTKFFPIKRTFVQKQFCNQAMFGLIFSKFCMTGLVAFDLCWIAACLSCCQTWPTPPPQFIHKRPAEALGLKRRSIERKSRPQCQLTQWPAARATRCTRRILESAARRRPSRPKGVCLGAGQLVMGWRELCLNVIIWR